MAQIALYFLACLMIVAIVDCLEFKMLLPGWVPSRELYCQMKDYPGECWALNIFPNGKPRCDQIYCAEKYQHGAYRRAIRMGPMFDGLRCGPVHVCYSGTCTKLARNVAMPDQHTSEVHYRYRCRKT